MSVGAAQLHYIFGLNADVPNSIWFLDEQTLIYPAGANCVIHNMDNGVQKFISVVDKCEGLSALAVSPNCRYIALAEKGEKPTVSIYDVHTLRKKKVLSSMEVQSEEYVSMAFSPDSKSLVIQGGKPDWNLLYWAWEKGRTMAAVKITNPQSTSFSVNQVTFGPKDSTQVCITGNSIFRCMRYTDGGLKTFFSYQKADSQNYLCHVWLSDEKIIVGTATGSLLLYESGEVKTEFRLIPDTSAITTRESRRFSGVLGKQVTCLVVLSNGVACACGSGMVYHYDIIDSVFEFRRRFMIPSDHFGSSNSNLTKQQIVCCLAVSPSDDLLVASTDQGQLYSLALSSFDTGKTSEAHFEIFSQVFHSAAVIDMDVCIRKPLAVTCSMDCSIKLWNYETCNLELNKVFNDEALCIALHPSGLFLLVGFSDKLRLMNLFIDDIKVFKEFPVKGCRECAFSNGGHMFASVMGNVIQLYTTYTFKNINNLKGHNGKVKTVVFSADDSKLISCGMDGAIYEWDTFMGKRIGESVLKTCMYSDIAVTPDGKSTFAVGSDKLLKEIADSRVLREVSTGEVMLTSVAMSHSGRMLFAGTSKGTLWSVKYPLTAAGDWNEYQGHSSAIVKVKIGYEDQNMISIAEDATVIIWKIHDKEGMDMKRELDFAWAEEILIVKKDLVDKNLIIADLTSKMEKARADSLYQLELKDLAFTEKMAELTETFVSEMERLKTKNQIIKTEKEQEEFEHETEIQELMKSHAETMENLEAVHGQKMVLKMQEFQEIQEKILIIQEDYDKQLSEAENIKEKALEALTEYYEDKLKDLNTKFGQTQSEVRQMAKENEEAVKQIEEDCDREVLDLRHTYEKKLREEKEANAKLSGENAILKKRFNTLHKEIDDLTEEIKKLQAQASKMTNVNISLEKDIEALKKNLHERDTNIQHKEANIFTLKRKNQELEKFRFVLLYKIKELRSQLEPKETDIKKMQEQIQGMEIELGKFHKLNIELEFTITELQQKLKATDKEMHRERQKAHDMEAVVHRFKTELHNCIGNIQDSKLFKGRIRALYQKHVVDDITETASVDADIQKEFTRQKDHLERSVNSLRKKLEKDAEVHRADVVKIMQENVALIKEISELRKELKLCRDIIHDMTSAMAIESRQKKNKAVESSVNKQLAPLVEQEMEEQKKIIEMQQMELKRLRDKMYDQELVHHHGKRAFVPKLKP